MISSWKRFLILLSVATQVLLAASPFIPWVRENIWSPQTSVSAFASTLASYVGVEFACLGFMVALFLLDIHEQGTKSTEQFRDLLQKYTPLQVRRLKENEFYKEFLGHCVKAKHYVKICYFAPVPPNRGAGEARKEYYRRLLKEMKENPDAKFTRIIRDTSANREWAEEMVCYLVEATNFSLALLKDLDSKYEMPLALSVQIVDVACATRGYSRLRAL